MKTLEIFRTGSHTGLNGKTIFFSEQDLIAIAKAYDPRLYRAPLVIGHPTIEAPAYGYVKALSYAAGSLFAEPDQVDGEFASRVNSGRYLSLSSSFYEPSSPSNPAPGSYYLRHVGFLGAAAPAVKGMTRPEFGDFRSNIIEFGVDFQEVSRRDEIPRDITRYV